MPAASTSAARADSSSSPASRWPYRSKIASAPTYASRHPADPHRHDRPPTTTLVCPHSPALDVAPRYVHPSETSAAPTPEPTSATTACRAPRPAPNHNSACPIVFAQFSNRNGNPVPARSSRSSGTASHPYAWQCTSTSRPSSTSPGTPTPTPITAPAPTPHSATTASSPARIRPTTTPTPRSRGSSRYTAFPRTLIARSNNSTSTRVSPISTPMTYPYSGFISSRPRGRPPSESTDPASMRMPSSSRSRTTMLTEAELNPVISTSSFRLRGEPR